MNLLLEGKCLERIRRILFGGKLIVLRKKDGGIRPIAVGCYWRRLTAKAANNRVMQSLAEYFSPLQLSVGVSGGCEAAASHGAFQGFIRPDKSEASLLGAPLYTIMNVLRAASPR